MGLTRVNLLAGLNGAYIIRDNDLEAPLELPSGDEFDRPLIVFDRSFRTDVNGKVWPRMTVRRRKYRFRILNACNARYLRLFFTNDLGFTHVASDSAYLEEPVLTNDTLLAPSEIADVVVDFSKSKTDFVILANDARYPYPSGHPVSEADGEIMKFIIQKNRESETWRVPSKLIKYPSPDLSSGLDTRYIAMYQYISDINKSTHFYINGKSYEEALTESPVVGSTDVWNVINLTPDNHPFHIHLGLFAVLDQTGLVEIEQFKTCMIKLNDAIECHISNYARGKKIEVPAHEKGWKNVYKILPGYVTKILVRFAYIHSNVSYPFDATEEPWIPVPLSHPGS
ncbi:hypothetical protein Patl1_15280 [Pistacia atlantica]|uniref:Uncharacterized protein n=1 Tax=Pistacia atlantica TaxID=434234 RepID=A0ACC1B8A6_9ROSI|nr:hypothetical protein Patl1_15280 [Pistacia atlantica]